MRTLMQRLLHVKTAPKDYSQGEISFTPSAATTGSPPAMANQLVITTPTQTLMLDNSGNYRVYDQNGDEIKDEKPQLALLLQVLTDVTLYRQLTA